MNSSPSHAQERSLDVSIDRESSGWTVHLKGSLDASTIPEVWRELTRDILRETPPRLRVEAAGIEHCDGSGVGFLFELHRLQEAHSGSFEIQDLARQYRGLLERHHVQDFRELDPHVETGCESLPEQVGRGTVGMLVEMKRMVAFIGELSVGLLNVVRSPGRLRWREAILQAEKVGVDALPIVLLISFLMGLIMAFQSVVPMQRFGAEIFVADLVALSVVKELGPLMTAIILAGRSGSAFAAEIGTMKVNEEVDALTTFGIEPVEFLAIPRVVSAALMAPLLTVLANCFGLVGGATVAKSLDIPLQVYFQRTVDILDVDDLMGGLVKAMVFGALIAAIGCLRGIHTGKGATAVGDSTTRSVVMGIITIIVVDGIFSVIYYYLGI